MTKIINLGSNTDRGFFSYLYTTFSAIYICDIKGEEFYIDWKSGVNYLSTEGENPFDYFFKQPYFDSYPIDGESFYDHGLFLGDDVILEDREKWNSILTKFLILKDDIKLEIQSYYNQNFLDRKILCVHKRGSDHVYHMPIQDNNEYFIAIDKEMSENNYDKIFLATDEENSINEFKEKYGDKLIYLNNIRTSNSTPIFKMSINKYQHTKEVIMDAYLLSMGTKLIKTKSTLTTMMCYLNKDLQYISIDNHIKFN